MFSQRTKFVCQAFMHRCCWRRFCVAGEQATGLYVAPTVGYQYFDSERFDKDFPVKGLENDMTYGLGMGYKGAGPWRAKSSMTRSIPNLTSIAAAV